MKNGRWVRRGAAAVSVLYFSTNVLWANTTESQFWVSRANKFRAQRGLSDPSENLTLNPESLLKSTLVVQHAPALSDDVSRPLPDTFVKDNAKLFGGLPLFLGTVRDVSFPTQSPATRTVVLIQDLHLHNEAQTNISKSLQSLAATGDLGVIGLEGAWDRLDMSWFHQFPDRNAVHKVGDAFLKANRITGGAHSAMTVDGAFPRVVGVDNEQHYFGNIEAYRRSAPLQERLKFELYLIRRDLGKQMDEQFSPALRDLIRAVEDHQEDRLPLTEYAAALTAVRKPAPGSAVASFIHALDLEKSIDFKAVDDQRNRLISRLTQGLNKMSMKGLLEKTLALRAGGIRAGDYYAALEGICQKAGLPLSEYPEFQRYVRYVVQTDRINAEKLFDELQDLEKTALNGLAKTPEQKKLLAQLRWVGLARRLADFALTPAEWKTYQGLKADALALSLPLSSFENFYVEAKVRDRALADNLIAAMNNESARTAALVVGGFHAAGLVNLLTQAGVAVVSFTPRISRIDDKGGAYLTAFSQEKTPLDKLFAGERLFVTIQPSPTATTAAAGAQVLQASDLPSSQKVSQRSALLNFLRTILPSSTVLNADKEGNITAQIKGAVYTLGSEGSPLIATATAFGVLAIRSVRAVGIAFAAAFMILVGGCGGGSYEPVSHTPVLIETPYATAEAVLPSVPLASPTEERGNFFASHPRPGENERVITDVANNNDRVDGSQNLSPEQIQTFRAPQKGDLKGEDLRYAYIRNAAGDLVAVVEGVWVDPSEQRVAPFSLVFFKGHTVEFPDLVSEFGFVPGKNQVAFRFFGAGRPDNQRPLGITLDLTLGRKSGFFMNFRFDSLPVLPSVRLAAPSEARGHFFMSHQTEGEVEGIVGRVNAPNNGLSSQQKSFFRNPTKGNLISKDLKYAAVSNANGDLVAVVIGVWVDATGKPITPFTLVMAKNRTLEFRNAVIEFGFTATNDQHVALRFSDVGGQRTLGEIWSISGERMAFFNFFQFDELLPATVTRFDTVHVMTQSPDELRRAESELTSLQIPTEVKAALLNSSNPPAEGYTLSKRALYIARSRAGTQAVVLSGQWTRAGLVTGGSPSGPVFTSPTTVINPFSRFVVIDAAGRVSPVIENGDEITAVGFDPVRPVISFQTIAPILVDLEGHRVTSPRTIYDNPFSDTGSLRTEASVQLTAPLAPPQIEFSLDTLLRNQTLLSENPALLGRLSFAERRFIMEGLNRTELGDLYTGWTLWPLASGGLALAISGPTRVSEPFYRTGQPPVYVERSVPAVSVYVLAGGRIVHHVLPGELVATGPTSAGIALRLEDKNLHVTPNEITRVDTLSPVSPTVASPRADGSKTAGSWKGVLPAVAVAAATTLGTIAGTATNANAQPFVSESDSARVAVFAGRTRKELLQLAEGEALASKPVFNGLTLKEILQRAGSDGSGADNLTAEQRAYYESIANQTFVGPDGRLMLRLNENTNSPRWTQEQLDSYRGFLDSLSRRLFLDNEGQWKLRIDSPRPKKPSSLILPLAVGSFSVSPMAFASTPGTAAAGAVLSALAGAALLGAAVFFALWIGRKALQALSERIAVHEKNRAIIKEAETAMDELKRLQKLSVPERVAALVQNAERRLDQLGGTTTSRGFFEDLAARLTQRPFAQAFNKVLLSNGFEPIHSGKDLSNLMATTALGAPSAAPGQAIDAEIRLMGSDGSNVAALRAVARQAELVAGEESRPVLHLVVPTNAQAKESLQKAFGERAPFAVLDINPRVDRNRSTVPFAELAAAVEGVVRDHLSGKSVGIRAFGIPDGFVTDIPTSTDRSTLNNLRQSLLDALLKAMGDIKTYSNDILQDILTTAAVATAA